MPFRRYFEIGRVALVKTGPLEGKLVVVVDIINLSKMLVDTPAADFKRIVLHAHELRLTDYKVEEIGRMPTKAALKSACAESGYEAAFAASSWGKKLARRTTKANMTDFQRFQAMSAKKTGKGKK